MERRGTMQLDMKGDLDHSCLVLLTYPWRMIDVVTSSRINLRGDAVRRCSVKLALRGGLPYLPNEDAQCGA